MNQAKVWILSNDKGEHLALEKDGQFTFFGSHTVYSREVLEKSFTFVEFDLLVNIVDFVKNGHQESGNYDPDDFEIPDED